MKEYKIRKEVGFGQDTIEFRKFLDEVEERINNNTEIIERAKEDNRKFYAALERTIQNVDKECIGPAVLDLIWHTPRYSYIKNLEFNGVRYEAEIDSLEGTFALI